LGYRASLDREEGPGRRSSLAPQANAADALEGAGELNVFDVLYAGEAGTLGQAITSTTCEELKDYDHILIDLPPALGRLTLNGIDLGGSGSCSNGASSFLREGGDRIP
jgi:hypothetical protein